MFTEGQLSNRTEKLFLPLFFLLLFLCSCGTDMVTVTHYKIANCRNYVNLRAEPTTSSAILGKVSLGTEVKLLRQVCEPSSSEYWSEIVIKESGSSGYVKSNFLEKWTTKEVIVPPTLAEQLADADQPVSAAVFAFINKCGDKITDAAAAIVLKKGAATNSGSNNKRLFWVFLTIALTLILAASIYFCETIQWWHFLIAIIFIPIEVLGITAMLPGSLSIKIGGFLIGLILNLIVFLLLISVPFLHWYSSCALIGHFIGDKELGETYIINTMLLLLIFLLCTYFFPSQGDRIFYVYLALNGVLFVFLNLIGYDKGAGPFRISFNSYYFRSLRGFLTFLSKVLVSFLSFFLLFAFTTYMVIPLIVATLGVGLLLFCGLVVVCIFLSPIGMGASRPGRSYELRDESGRFVDTIDSSGWDTGGGGRHYSKGSDGRFRRDN